MAAAEDPNAINFSRPVIGEIEEQEEKEGGPNGRLWEIEEEAAEGVEGRNGGWEEEEDVVYVGVLPSEEETAAEAEEKYNSTSIGSSSMEALVWTLNHAVAPAPSSTTVCLVHVFPVLKFIPTPLGNMPIKQANPEQKEMYTSQQRAIRRDFLQKFINTCSASKMKVDTILIESDSEAKAILDLIPILNIKRLVLGTHKSTLRKMKSKRGSGTADQVRKDAPKFCDVKIICEGKELPVESTVDSPPRSSRGSPRSTQQAQTQINEMFMCGCFKSKMK